MAVGRYPDDPLLAALIGELGMHRSEFIELWSKHNVRAWDLTAYRMRHPLDGAMDLTQQAVPVPGQPGQRLLAVTAAAGSASQTALTPLARATTPDGQPVSTRPPELGP